MTDWAKRAETYNNLYWVNKSRLNFEMMTAMGAASSSEGNLLDLGCGSGFLIRTLQTYFIRMDYYAIDRSPEMLALTRDRELSLYLRTYCGDMIEQMNEFDPDYFRWVTAKMSLHHTSDVNATFKAVHRILTSDGTFVVCEGIPPNPAALNWFKNMFALKEHRHTFMPLDLLNLFHKHKFHDITLRFAVFPRMRLRNWLENSDLSQDQQALLWEYHQEMPSEIKKAYNFAYDESGDDNDIVLDWRFVIASGRKLKD